MTSELELRRSALQIRIAIVRAIAAKGGGHIGGSLDLAELVAVLYSDFMRVHPKEPQWPQRDMLVCSKGHAGPALYAALALAGFFPYKQLHSLNQENTQLPGHCDRLKVPGIDATTGSLGQGLSIACGIALGSKLAHMDRRTFCITGDGESAEGQIWEAAQLAAHYQLDSLIAFLDWNKMQIDGSNDQVMALGDPVAKYAAFGWNACRVKGDDVIAIQQAIQKKLDYPNGKPSMIVLDTVKGAGVTCVAEMDNNHCIGFSKSLAEKAMAELLQEAVQLRVEVPEWN